MQLGVSCTLQLLLLLAAGLHAQAASYVPGTVHTIFSTECNPYFDWQTMGLVYSAKKVGQPGPITRLMACDKPDYKHNLKDVDTHTHPNWAKHPVTGDHYSPYNKPASIVHWLENTEVTAEYIIILDADMVIRNAITNDIVKAERGRPVSAHYGYLVGIFPDHYMKVKERVKNVEKAQQVGGFSVMHVEDLRKVAPLWLKWTEEVRQDPESWGNTGDIFNDNGKAGPPWISEMYGYTFACAEAGMDFQVSDKFMLYPGYAVPAPDPWPVVMHYGITYNVFDYAFDKHWYMATDMTSCPGKIFPKPPKLSDLPVEPGTEEYRRLDVALTVAYGLYESSRLHVIEVCGVADPPDPPYPRYKCTMGQNNVNMCQPLRDDESPDFSAQIKALRGSTVCEDDNANCCDWASKGECTKNSGYMAATCKAACGKCKGGKVCAPVTDEVAQQTFPPPPVRSETTVASTRAVVTLSDAMQKKTPTLQHVSTSDDDYGESAFAAALRGHSASGMALWGGGLMGVGIILGRRVEARTRRASRAARSSGRKGV